MINVACLERRWFAEILAGKKTTEYRTRKRLDKRLEDIQKGERLYLLEKGTTRGIEATIAGKRRRTANSPDAKYEYAIKFCDWKLKKNCRIRHLQGWIRSDSLSQLRDDN